MNIISNLNKEYKKIIVNLPLGFGKSVQTIEAAKGREFKRPHLIVVNTTKEVDRFRSELGESYSWYYQTQTKQENWIIKDIQTSIKSLMKLNPEKYKDLDIKFKIDISGEEEEVLMGFQFNNPSKQGLIITKKKFNELLKTEDEYNFLNRFNSITFDEINELEFVFKEEFNGVSDSAIKAISNFSLKELEENRSFFKRVEIPKFENPQRFFEKLSNINEFCFVLKEKSSHSFIYMKNEILFKFLKEFDGTIMILDATAEQNKYIYSELLENSIFEYYSEEKVKYPNLKIVYETFETKSNYSIKMGELRCFELDKKEVKEKKLERIKHLKIKQHLIFTNKATAKVMEKDSDFSKRKLNYIYSGDDIGSNKYRNYTEMCILYGQTMNKNNIEIHSTFFKRTKDEIKEKMIAQRIIQLIGRTKIREGSKKKVEVRIIQFPELNLDELKEYFHCEIEKRTITFDEQIIKKKSILELTIESLKQKQLPVINVSQFIKDVMQEADKADNRNTRKLVSKELKKHLPSLGYEPDKNVKQQRKWRKIETTAD